MQRPKRRHKLRTHSEDGELKQKQAQIAFPLTQIQLLYYRYVAHVDLRKLIKVQYQFCEKKICREWSNFDRWFGQVDE